MQRSLALLPLALGLSCGPSGGANSVGSADQRSFPDQGCAAVIHRLSVVTYNLNYGLATSPSGADQATVAQIAELGADVVLFQETNPVWEQAIRGALGESHPHQRFHDPGRFIAGGIGVASRFPITDDKLFASPVDWFPAQRTIVSAEFGPLQLLNVHLRPAISDGGSWVAGYFSTGHYREREARAYLPTLDNSMVTIVGGDFNEEDRGGALKIFREFGLDSALDDHPASTTTWRWEAHGLPLSFRLDHLLFQPGRLKLASAEVLGGGNSDHLPVRAVFEHSACAL